MRLRTFDAPTISEAMRMVRTELGEDAIIVSTESERGRRPARVVAAIEDDPPIPLVSTPLNTNDLPADEAIERALAFHGLPSPLIQQMLDAAREFLAEGALLALSASIDTVVGFQPLCEQTQSRPILLFGPPGAGKTLSAAKLLLRARQAGRPAAAISTDVARAGGIEQLEAFTRILDLPLESAASPREMAAMVADISDRLVVVDTAGANLFDETDLDTLAHLAIAAGAEPVAVFAASGDVAETVELAAQAASIGCRRMLVSRIDIARRLGSLITAAEASGLALADVGVSPQVADGLTPLNPVSLARLLMPEADKAAPSSARRRKP